MAWLVDRTRSFIVLERNDIRTLACFELLNLCLELLNLLVLRLQLYLKLVLLFHKVLDNYNVLVPSTLLLLLWLT
jgi:hypothetical protein